MAQKSTEQAAPSTPAPQFPTLSIIEKRIASGGRNIIRPRHVPLKNQPEPMITWVINTEIDGRWYQVTTELGWVAVTPEEIDGGPQGDMRVSDGRVVMGEHGREVLVKMPVRLYQAVQRAKEARQHREMTSKSALIDKTRQGLEQDAKTLDRAGADDLAHAAEGLSELDVQELRVSRERVPLDR